MASPFVNGLVSRTSAAMNRWTTARRIGKIRAMQKNGDERVSGQAAAVHSDEMLLDKYRHGDVGALDELVQRHRDTLYGYIHGMTRAAADADDVFQETWFKAIRSLAGYRADNFRGWLMRIARNTVIDRVRRQRPEIPLDEDPDEGHGLLERLPGPGPTPDAELAGREETERILAAVATLPAEQREVFLMRTRSDLPFKEIAALQKVSINTALARMQYAINKLRTALAPVEPR